MNLSLPNSVTRAVAMTVLKTKKNSPTILFGAGIALGVATVVSSCKATLKLEALLDETKSNLEVAQTLDHADYSEKDRQRDVAVIYVQTAARVTKLYGPALILGTLSVAALTGSHRILNSRNAALTAAYTAIDKAFSEYRQRVTDEFGETKDRELRYGSDLKTVVIEDKNGPKKKSLKVAGEGSRSMYARIFDEHNQNWSPQPEYNIAFLRLQQNYANDRLRARGHLFLNEVYDLLGMDHTPAGSQVGWLWNKGSGDDFVDFGIWTDKSMRGTIDFLTGLENAVVLDFNVDGVIWERI